MAESYVTQVELRTNVEKVLEKLKETQDRMDKLEGKEYKINLGIDAKTLESVIQKLDKMLNSLGKGTGDFKQLESLSKQLESITSDVRDFSKAFGKIDDSGAKTLLSFVQNIDKSLSELSQNILNVNKNMGNMGVNTSGAVKQVENISNAYQNAAKEAEKLADAQSKIGQKTNISSGSTTSVIDNQIKKQNEYNDLVAVGYDRIQKMKKISESGTTGSNSVYDLLRLNHKAWDEVKANNFFNKIPEEGLKRYIKILEVVEKIVQEMVQASGLTEEQIVSQLKNIKTAQGGNFKLNGADSGWTHFATYSNGQKDSMQKVNGITYKVYAAFDDIKDLNQNVVSSIMNELTKAGFKGRLKTTSGSTSFGDKLNGLAITDQMVVHGSTKKDQEIAYNTLKNMGLKLSYLGGGIDTPDGSFSQTLASGEINKYIQGLEKEATVARDTAKAEQQLVDARKESSTASTEQKKDAFQGSTSSDAKSETQSIEQIEKATKQAIQAKKDFATANEGVQSSIDDSKNPLKLEAELMDQIAKSAREAADAKKEFVEANKQVKKTANDSNSDLKAKPKKDRYVNRRKVSEEDFLNYSPNKVNEKLSNSGYTILGETVNTELVDGLVKVNAKIKDADGAWKSFSAKIDADGNIFEQRFRTITKGVDKLETALQNFGRETAPALTYQETLEKAQKIRKEANIGDEYSIKVDSNEFVTITKKLSDIDNAGASVTQTFKSAQDAIDNFGKTASNSAEKTSVALKSIKEKTPTSSISNDIQKQQPKTLKDEWENAIKTVKEYESTVSKLNNLKASDKGLGAKTADIEAQQKKIDGMKSSFESAQTTILSFFSSMDKFNSLPVSSIKEVQDAIKLIQTAANGSAESVARLKSALKNMQEASVNKLENKLSKYQGKIDSYNSTIAKFSGGGWTSPEYLKNVNQTKTLFEQYRDALNLLKQNPDLINKDSLNNLDELESKLKKVISTIQNMSAAQKGFSLVAGQKELDKIRQILKDNSAMSAEAKARIKAYYNQIKSGNPSASLDVIHGKILEIVDAEAEAGRSGKRFLDILKEKAWYGAASVIGTYFGVDDAINVVKEMASTVTDLNTQITELAKVSEASSSQIYADFSSYANIAKQVRGTISDTISATADWSKNGYNLPDAKQLAEVSQLYKNVGDGIDINTANESLISTLRGFQLNPDQAEHIVDVFNEVSNNEAISSAGIGEALQRSAASFNAASTSLEKSVALVSATNSVLQDPEKVGKQILAYLYSNVMKIKVAISVKILRRTRPRKDYNVCFNY